jgi:hypothetical protein
MMTAPDSFRCRSCFHFGVSNSTRAPTAIDSVQPVTVPVDSYAFHSVHDEDELVSTIHVVCP